MNDETIEKIKESYKKCGIVNQVAREFKISPYMVKKYVQGIEYIAPPKRKKSDLKNEEIEQINKEYSECKNMSEVGRMHNVTANTVKSCLTKENLEINNLEHDYKEELYFYLIRLFGIESEDEPISKHNWELMQKYRKKGISYQTQYLTLKYYYDICHHQVKEEYKTIGIIPYIIDEAANYYKEKEKKRQMLEKEMKKQLTEDRVKIKYDPRKYNTNRKDKQKKKVEKDWRE